MSAVEVFETYAPRHRRGCPLVRRGCRMCEDAAAATNRLAGWTVPTHRADVEVSK